MYRVNEIFYSLQGEGLYTGTPMVFVRLAGCNRRCTFCDTEFETFTEMSADEIVAEADKYAIKRVVVTGGEPLLQLDDNLVNVLHKHGYSIHLETNGTLSVPDGVDHVVCSPKDENIAIQPEKVDEVKIVYTGQPVEYLNRLRDYFCFTELFYLQPCSGKNINETVHTVLSMKGWRLSLQTHLLIGIK